VAARVALLAVLALAAACAGDDDRQTSEPPPEARPAGPFAYRAAAPLNARERTVGEGADGAVRDVEFGSPGSGRVRAYLVTPKRAGRRPAVVFLHGAGGNRDEFLPDAAIWVRDGGVALTIEAAPLRAASTPRGQLRQEREVVAHTVVRVRRAVDYLATQQRVDPDRIGFVGWSAGARTGAIVAGVERRISAFVLMSAGATPLSEYIAASPPELKDDVERVLAPVDPLRWIERARPRTIFFQNATQDEIVPREALENLIRAAPKPQRVRWYAADHALNERARSEQRAWLAAKLALE
jgi:dienelactone hydrolase